VSAGPTAPNEVRRQPLSDDARLAARNAAKLILSLAATWSVALVVRLWLPRHLGPEKFGLFSLAESLAVTYIGFTTLGIDDYTQREIPVRPRHASDYFGGVTALRLCLGVLLLIALWASLRVSGRSAETIAVATVFGLGYVAQIFTQSQGVFLTARGTVNRLAITNVVAKLAWGGFLLVALVLGAPLAVLAAAFLVGQLVRAAMLHAESSSHGLEYRIDVRAVRAVVLASTPYFANQAALYLNRLDVPILAYVTGDDRAVGWYGAAMSFSQLVFLVAPVMGSVLLPLMSRAWARSESDLWTVVHKCAGGIIALATPIALIVMLGADIWIRLAFGESFGPAVLSLRVFALQAVLTYLTLLMAMALVAAGRAWRLTLSSAIAIVARVALVAALVPPCARVFGTGGAGAGAAVAVVLTELVALSVMLRGLRRQALGDRLPAQTAKSILAFLAASAVHVALGGLGPWRLPIDVAVYLGLALLLGALPLGELVGFVREAIAARRTESSPAS